jgi:hypothetical protein
MITRNCQLPLLLIPALLLAAAAARGQQNSPHAAFVYPAGGRVGSSFEVTVGGQFLDGAKQVFFAGDGLKAEITGFSKPLSQKELDDLRAQLKELEQSHSNAPVPVPAKPASSSKPTQPPAGTTANKPEFTVTPANAVTPSAKDGPPEPPKPHTPTPWTSEDRKLAADLHKQIDASMRMRAAPALSQSVRLRVTVDAQASPGNHELRLLTNQGLTNPLNFLVDRFPESSRPFRFVPLSLAAGGGLPLSAQAHAEASEAPLEIALPAMVNGQMMPGSTDRYRFHAEKGQKIVIAAMTRALIPYMSDAVPGWFQAVLTLSDAKGKELVSADHFRFNQEPVIEEEIAEKGDYILSVRDILNRGREDFVYRIAIGEIPYVTGIFPMGGKSGTRTKVEATGWNLPSTQFKEPVNEPGIHEFFAGDKVWSAVNPVAFSVDTLPETIMKQNSSGPAHARRIKLPQIVNGRIDHPGDVQFFRIEAQAGEEMVAEVEARRLGSPLDSSLTLTDSQGKQLAFNDDFEDKGAALLTHQADSRLIYRFPAQGAYYLQLADTEQNGGPETTYRLRISHPRPDFELRIAPSSINLHPGRTVPATVLLIRRDGFDGAVTLRIKDGPPGLVLGGGMIPAGTDTVRVTLTAPTEPVAAPHRFLLEGEASIDGQTVRHAGLPAEDMMQAFLWRSMVPVEQAMLCVLGNDHRKPLWSTIENRLSLPVGGTALLRLALPPGQAANQIQLALSDPPDGIGIADVSQAGGFLTVRFSADGKVKPGLAGNLIVEASAIKPSGASDPPPKNKRPVPLGILPAIPYEVVQPFVGKTREPLNKSIF